MKHTTFSFRQFSVVQCETAHKVGTDGVLLGAWADVEGSRRILDIGTGTGLIALMAAQRTDRQCRITAIDADAESTELAAKNFAVSPWSERLEAHHVRLQDFPGEHVYDHILVNPPYFVNSLAPPDQKRKLQRHTDELPFSELAEHTARLLTSDGKWSLILPVQESRKVELLAIDHGVFVTRELLVAPRTGAVPNRRLLEFGFSRGDVLRSTLVLMDEEGKRHTKYAELTNNFYL